MSVGVGGYASRVKNCYRSKYENTQEKNYAEEAL